MSEETSRMGAEADSIDESSERTYPEEVKTKSGTSNVVRFLDGSDAFRKYSISWFLCDDDTIKPFVIENETEGKSILSKVLGNPEDFYRGGYLESKKGPVGKIFVHQAKDPELFKRVTEYYNPAFGAPGTARPSTEYVFNVIHRNPQLIGTESVVWCVLNKHTKLMRFKKRAFKSLNVVRQNSGRFEEYDVLFSKQGKGSDTFFSSMKADIGTQYNVVGSLTEEEMAYERYDLDQIVGLATANYILKTLRNTLSRIDAVMGTAFVAELEAQKVLEEQAYLEGQLAPAETAAFPTPSVPEMTSTASNQTTRQPIVTQPTVPTPQPFIPAPVPQATQPPVQEVPQSRVPATEAMITCGHCKEQTPAGLVHCTKCNGALVLNCDACKQPFDAFASQCPHCGQQYATNP